jgi:hypothetical protein
LDNLGGAVAIVAVVCLLQKISHVTASHYFWLLAYCSTKARKEVLPQPLARPTMSYFVLAAI